MREQAVGGGSQQEMREEAGAYGAGLFALRPDSGILLAASLTTYRPSST